jgi:hypothetical protein
MWRIWRGLGRSLCLIFDGNGLGLGRVEGIWMGGRVDGML